MKIRKNFRLQNELIRKAEIQSEEENTSLTKVVENALSNYVKDNKTSENCSNMKVVENTTTKASKVSPTKEEIEQGRFVLKFRENEPPNDGEVIQFRKRRY